MILQIMYLVILSMSRAKKGDWLIAVGFTPYAQETLTVVEHAVAKKMNILAITDSNVSPLAQAAKVTLLTQEHSTFNFRSLSNSICIAQSLIVGMTHTQTTGQKKSPKSSKKAISTT